MEATMLISDIIIASGILLASGNRYLKEDKGTFSASDSSNTPIDCPSCDNTDEETSFRSAEKKGSSVSELDAQEYITSSARNNVPWTSWIDCPPSCNRSDGGTFRMRSFRSSSEKNLNFELESKGYINASENISKTTEKAGSFIDAINIYVCNNEKEITQFLVINATTYKRLCKNDVRHETTVCTKSVCKDAYGSSCNCFHVVDSAKTETSNRMEMTSASSLEGHTMELADATTLTLIHQNGHRTTASIDNNATEQQKEIITKDEFGQRTNTYSSSLTMWILITVTVIVIILVTTISVGVFKTSRRLQKKNAEIVDTTTQNGHNYTDITLDINEQPVNELGCLDLDAVENEYDVAFHWKKNHPGQSNVYDHVCQPYYQVSFNREKKEVDPENDYETASNVHRNIT